MSTFDESKIRRGQPENAGQFATKANTTPSGALEAIERPTVPGTLVLQRWSGVREDYAEEVGTVDVDLHAIMDTMPLDDIRAARDEDDYDPLFDQARAHGLVRHTGPFEVQLDPDELDRYMDAREAADQQHPLNRTLRRDKVDAAVAVAAARSELQEARMRQRVAQSQFIAAHLAEDVPNARHVYFNYSTATLAIYDEHHEHVDIAAEMFHALQQTFIGMEIDGRYEL